MKEIKFEGLESVNRFKSLDFDVYHITSGARFNIKDHMIFAGVTYAFGSRKSLPTLVNMSDPVEYSESEGAGLQGPRYNTMNIAYTSFSFYFGATFSFGNQIDNK